MTFDTSAKICIFLLASQDLIRVFSWFFLQKITMIRGSALRITLATLESAIAAGGCSAGGLFVGFGLGDSGVLTRKEWGENRKPWFWNAPEWKDGGMFLYVWWFESIVFVHL